MNKKNKIAIIVAVIVGLAIIGGTIATKNKTSGNNDDKQVEISKTNDKYLDALRKCTVMEAADIYNTGIGRKSSNVFDDAKATCEGWYSDWGEKDFFDAVYTDWDNRKSETIEDKDLNHYLNVLGW